MKGEFFIHLSSGKRLPGGSINTLREARKKAKEFVDANPTKGVYIAKIVGVLAGLSQRALPRGQIVDGWLDRTQSRQKPEWEKDWPGYRAMVHRLTVSGKFKWQVYATEKYKYQYRGEEEQEGVHPIWPALVAGKVDTRQEAQAAAEKFIEERGEG
jgi:hypothetical protein